MITGIPANGGYFVINYEDKIIKRIYWQKNPVEINTNFPFYHLFYSYFNGEKVDFSNISIDLSDLPPFYKRVYEVARRIPYGKVTSYKILAEKVNSKNGARAIGQAMAKNPYLLIIPCHRVIKDNGEIGKFSLGEDFKMWLLKLEGVEDIIYEGRKILSNRYWWY